MRLRLLATSLLLTVTSLGLATQRPGSDSVADYTNRQPPPIAAATKKEMEARLSEAKAQYEASPRNPDAIIWVGRRLAYLGRFREAIDIYSEGIKVFPGDARFYRHRGHRYITLRNFELAIADLEKAAQLTRRKPDEVEPDGQPNSRNVPTSTLQFNIWYHLGLAYYLAGNNQQALKSYRACLKVSKSPDRLVATSHWLYMTLRRLNQTSEAANVLKSIKDGMDVIENTGYYRLLLMYKGLLSSESLMEETLKQEGSAASHSVLYGIGNWSLYNGRREDAEKVFNRMLESDQWTSFGYIAAEADMKRIASVRTK